MSSDLDRYLAGLPGVLRKDLARRLRRRVEGLRDAIRRNAPEGPTGHLRESVQIVDGRDELELVVVAGGELTTKTYGRDGGYRREVTVGQGDNRGIARGNAGVTYDYALANEFGTEKMAAQPFFYSTYAAERGDLERGLTDDVVDVLGDA